MKGLGFLLCLAAIVTFSSSSHGQYAFESKKAEKLYNKLEGYYQNYDFESILEHEEDISSYYLNKKDTLAALMYSFLGESYLSLNADVQKSLGFYEKELALRKELQKPEDYKELIFNIAYLYDELSQYKKSEGLFFDLLKLEEETVGKKSEDYFTTASTLIDHYINSYQISEGLKLAEDLKKHVKKNTYNEALLLRAFGELYGQTGAFKKAEKSILEGIDLLHELGYYPSLDYVGFLNTLAILYTDQAKLNVVEEIYNEALSILSRLQGDYEENAIIIKSNLASLYFELGNHTEAEKLYKEVLAFDKDYFGEDSYSYGFTHYNLGLNSFYAKKYVDAVTYLEKASAIYNEAVGTDNLSYARTASVLSKSYTQIGKFELAKQKAEEALKAYEKAVGKNHFEYAFALESSALVYETLDEQEKAEGFQTEALALRGKVLGKYHPYYALSSRQMAIFKWRRNEVDDALTYYDETFDNYFTQINNYFPVLSEEEKSKFYYNSLKPTFEQFNSFIVENKSEEKELLGKMYDYQLATKGLILYATNKVRESILSSKDSVLINKYETWISQKEQLAKLFSAADIPLEERNARIDSLNKIANRYEKELSQASSTFAQTFANRDLSWKDVQAKLKPGEAAVEIIRFRDFAPDSAGVFTDEVYYAALIVTTETKEAPEMVLMRNGKMMETRYLSNYRNAIKYKVDEDYSYRLFWKPIANKLQGIKKVYFSPDGVFNQISIYTLRNPDTGNFTLDEVEIQVLTNTKDLVAFNKQATGSNSYLFGYPNYNMGAIDEVSNGNSTQAGSIVEAASEDRGVRGAVRGTERGVRGQEDDLSVDLSSLTRGGSIPRGLRGNLLRYMRSNQTLSLLPGTKKEVNLIDSLYQKRGELSITYLSNDALEDSIKIIKNPRTLHIATHGFFLESGESNDGQTDEYVENPLLRSGLILAGANSFISKGEISDKVRHDEDGILTAYEAMNLKLDGTELVVLSACETGLGEVKNGEGVYGLQRAFQVAGADAIIMSMWTVDDDATQELMTNFYEEWLNGADKQVAFITAQKRLKDKWKSPYYWGAFVMIGQ